METGPNDAKTLSQELGRRLRESLVLMEKYVFSW